MDEKGITMANDKREKNTKTQTKAENSKTKTARTQGESAKNQGQFHLINQYVSDLSFECPQPPVHLGDYQNNISLDVGVQSRPLPNPSENPQKITGKGGETHEVTVVLRGHNKTADDKTVYLLEMKYSGLFALEGIPAEHVHGLLGVEAPALLYPFARQLFMGTVSASGFQPPMLEPINFAAVYMQQQAQKQQAANA